MTRTRYAVALLALSLSLAGVAGCSPAPAVDGSRVPASAGASGASASTLPVEGDLDVRVEVVASGLEHPWDLGFLPDGRVLVTERPGRLKLLSSAEPGASVTQVEADLADVGARGEGGLMGLLVQPDFASSRAFLTCQTHDVGGSLRDIRIVRWQLAADGSAATRLGDLLTGLPVASGGRHSGCRMAIDDTGALLVGTGDTAVGSIPQDRTSLGGKVLRVSLQTGEGLPDNPFATSADANERRVLSYGHRNIQGITVDAAGEVITAEHGPSFDDEVNQIRAGGNYGWDPSRGGEQTAYDESVSMTDTARFPDAVPARWTSGETTQAICAVAVLGGDAWPGLEGALVVTALKGAKLLVLPRRDGEVTAVKVPPQSNGPFGRLRAARVGPDGALYVSTSNGSDDQVLRITPAT
ncbi:MAG: PQQ-dependent sugar dehydrogenase [Dermatophilaceae bacterium]